MTRWIETIGAQRTENISMWFKSYTCIKNECIVVLASLVLLRQIWSGIHMPYLNSFCQEFVIYGAKVLRVPPTSFLELTSIWHWRYYRHKSNYNTNKHSDYSFSTLPHTLSSPQYLSKGHWIILQYTGCPSWLPTV